MSTFTSQRSKSYATVRLQTHCVAIGEKKSANELFDFDAYVEEHAEDNREFFSRFIHTTLFTSFLEQYYSPDEETQHEMEHFRELLTILKNQDFKSLIAHENDICKSVAKRYQREVKISIDKCFAIYQKKFTFQAGTPLHEPSVLEESNSTSEEEILDKGLEVEFNKKSAINRAQSPPLTCTEKQLRTQEAEELK